MPYNGNISNTQLGFINQHKQETKCIIFSHIPLHPGCSGPFCLHWEWETILEAVKGAELCVSGHRHKGGYYEGEGKFLTVEGVIEFEEPVFYRLDIFEDKMILKGQGTVKDRLIRLNGR